MTDNPVTHTQVWRIATPIIIGHISVPLLGMVDTGVVGRLHGPEPLAALAVGNLIFSYLYWGFGFLRMGTTGPTAQAWGAGRHHEVAKLAQRAFALGLAIGLMILLLQIPILNISIKVVSANHRVEELAARYFQARIWGAPAALCNFVVVGWLLGIQKIRSVLWLQLWMNGLNIVLDILMVFVWHQGVAGVGYATAISEYSALALGLFFMRHFSSDFLKLHDWKDVLHPSALAPMVSINRDLFIRTLCLISTFATMTVMGARMGSLVLASNTLLMNFQLFASYSLDGFAHAAETLVGQALGAKNKERYWSAIRTSTVWAGVMAGLYVLGYALFGPYLMDALTVNEQVRESARIYLPWLVLSPLLSVWSYQLDGIFAGSTRSAEMRNSMLVSFLCFFMLVFLFVPRFQNHGLWAALMAFMLLRGITLGLRLRPSGSSQRGLPMRY